MRRQVLTGSVVAIDADKEQFGRGDALAVQQRFTDTGCRSIHDGTAVA